MDQAESFLPLYLRFIKGVVDSNDLSLNVSREILQKDPIIDSMKSALTKRVLDMLEKLAIFSLLAKSSAGPSIITWPKFFQKPWYFSGSFFASFSSVKRLKA